MLGSLQNDNGFLSKYLIVFLFVFYVRKNILYESHLMKESQEVVCYKTLRHM